MKTAIGVGGYARGAITGAGAYVQAADRVGVDYVWSAEAWAQDAVDNGNERNGFREHQLL